MHNYEDYYYLLGCYDVSRKVLQLYTFTRLHGVTSQKSIIFIATSVDSAVRT
jgi:hypothetical protein